MIKIVSVGKKHDPLFMEGINNYEKRLRPPFNVKWEFIPHSALKGPDARLSESRAILLTLKPTDFVILLDERGSLLDSPKLSALLAAQFSKSLSVVIIIGGAFGVDNTLTARADKIWSLSPLVFPHQLVRLILSEQLYRAQSIDLGLSYHHF